MRACSSLILHPSSLRHRGYSFTEVMFAVVVLGIGFIMIAAMFPVAISQTQTTAQESTAASIARGALNQLQAIANRHTMRPTDGGTTGTPAPIWPFTGVFTPAGAHPPPPAVHGIAPPNTGSWQAVKGNLILQTDPRFAYVPFYSRKSGSSFAQVIMVVTQCRARPTYDAADVTPDEDANLQPRAVKVTITNNGGGTGIDRIFFEPADAPAPDATTAVAEGAYVVIAEDPGVPGDSPPHPGAFNGRVYRVGLQATDPDDGELIPDTWTLQPGNEYRPEIQPNGDIWDIGDEAEAFIVGRELVTPGDPDDGYQGLAQDVAVYTSFVQVR